MLSRCLAVLLSLPLLLPPGVCVCACRHDPEAGTEIALTDDAPAGGCACEHRRSADADLSRHGNAPHTGPRTPADPDRHAPHCPARVVGARLPAPGPVVVAAAPSVCLLDLPPAVPRSALVSDTSLGRSSSDPPRYLTLRILRL